VTTPATDFKSAPGPYRVMVVDDSAVIRGIVTRWLEADPSISVVASCANGVQALRMAPDRHCEVIVLDIEMPEMDGITALPKLIKALPGVQVVMSSTLTRRNADISMRALAMGAADYVTKPETLRGATAADDFRRELVEKVKALAIARRNRERRALAPEPLARGVRAVGLPEIKPAGQSFALRHMPPIDPAVLAIGSSTGGPQALMEVMRTLGPSLSVPVVITQHMPETFTAILAEHLAQVSRRPCAEGRTGDVVKPGSIFVAPGGRHMELVQDRNGVVSIALNDGPPENFCKPSVDPLFRSAAQIYGKRALALVLTGMGHDGREGGRAIVQTDGVVVGQDEATSVVWGMPGAVAMAGLCSAVWPLDKIGLEIKAMLGGGRRAS
jgi:two-component system, chemotaxis family, protein-glutamate methylesterase/glutaminase